MSQSKCRNKFSAMFWNVENLGKSLPAVGSKMSAEKKEARKRKHHKRVKKVADHIKALDPDLFCLCEIWDKAVLRRLLMHELTDYDFAVTDGGGNIELVTAWKRGTFKQVIFAQRVKFQAGNEDLRPGALASVKFGGEWFNFLFLHLKSGSLCSAYKLREDMFEKIWALKDRLDGIHTDELRDGASDSSASSNGASDNSASSNGAKFVVMGDLNTMGRSNCAHSSEISAAEELQKLEQNAQSNGMRLLPKTHCITWPGNSYPEGNLDHVLATKNVCFRDRPKKEFPDAAKDQRAKVRVSGWNTRENDEDRQKFIDKISDHCSLFCEIAVNVSETGTTGDADESNTGESN